MAVSPADWIREQARRHMAARDAAVERACEEALTTGVCGVAVVTDGTSTYVGVSAAVPYGTIGHFPTVEAFLNACILTADPDASPGYGGLEPPADP